MKIEKLFQLSKREKIPDFDLSNKIINSIKSQKIQRISLKPFGIMASLAGVAASIILFFAVQVNRIENSATGTFINYANQIVIEYDTQYEIMSMQNLN